MHGGNAMPSRELRSWMWAEALALLERAERLHRQFFQIAPAEHGAWEAPVDLFETERALWILVALPGVAPAQVRTHLDTGILVVSGERALPAALRAGTIHRLEIPYGRFERRIELPPGRFEVERQELTHGCLVLELRKR